MTQGKIERYHRSMKNIILLDNCYLPRELEAQIARSLDYYSNQQMRAGISEVVPVS